MCDTYLLYCTLMYSFPMPGTVLGGASQCDDSSGLCDGGVTLRPCCVGLDAGCLLTSQENCSFQNGYWHTNAVGVPE